DATGAWFVYPVNAPGTSKEYPQIGLNQDAVVVTYNDFAASETARTFAVAKALAYTGHAFSVPTFTLGPNGTATPPNVLDQNPRVHELFFQPGTGAANVTFTNPQSGAYGRVTSASVPALLATVPPDAEQPGSGACPAANCIDTGDGRLSSDPTQF